MAHTLTEEAERERFGWADGLRGLAALSVLAYEIIRHAPGLHWSTPLAQRAALTTAHGFDALLVLSGLLLASPVLTALRRSRTGTLNLARFALGRALRILPAYYLVLAATVLVPLAAATYGIGGLSHTVPSARDAALQAIFAGNGFGNDGFTALCVQVRLLALFPLLLAVYAFAPAIFAMLAGLALYADYATPVHHWGVGGAAALMLGIVAADVLARGLSVARFAWPAAVLAAAGAFALDPVIAGLPGPAADASFLVWDPLWALAAAALAVACAQTAVTARILGANGLGQLAGPAYALVLVADPLSSFALTHAAQGSSPWLPAGAAGMCLAAAFALWLIVDRAATGSRAAHAFVDAASRPFADAATMTLGLPLSTRRRAATAAAAQVEDAFGPLPVMHPGMLATVVHRVGSFEDLQSEIETIKRRLAEAASGGGAFYEQPGLVGVPEQLVLARNDEPVGALEGVVLGADESNPRKVVTLALGANRPQRPTVRVRFGPALEGARAS
jgi:peptidoglycan/LPS O-acetylase OafA/YrhL